MANRVQEAAVVRRLIGRARDWTPSAYRALHLTLGVVAAIAVAVFVTLAEEVLARVFDWITSVIERLGYLGVATLTFLEHLFPPIPSELVIPLAGFVAARDDLRLPIVIVMPSVGSLAGATMWYVIGRRVGERRLRQWVGRHGKWLTLSEEDVDHAQLWFRRHGATAVFVGRLIPGVRTFVSLPAGFSSMPLGPFVMYSALGTVIWTAALAYAGVLLQANFTLVGDYLNLATSGLLAVGGVLIVRRYIRCWKAAGG